MGYLAEHRHYLADQRRNDAYERALSDACRDEPVVVDLGAGTGLLGFVALRSGASRVYGIERTGLSEYTAANARLNGFEDRYRMLQGASMDVELPEQADLIVCDQMGAFILDGHPLPIIADAARRFLKPGGRLMPHSVEFGITPAFSQGLDRAVEHWGSEHSGLRFDALRRGASSDPKYEKLTIDDLRGERCGLGVLDLREERRALDLTATSVITKDGAVNALCGWFRAELGPDATITNEPGTPELIDRETANLPLDPPLHCAAGDVLTIRIRALLHDRVLTWSVEHPTAGVRRHSTWESVHIAATPRRSP